MVSGGWVGWVCWLFSCYLVNLCILYLEGSVVLCLIASVKCVFLCWIIHCFFINLFTIIKKIMFKIELERVAVQLVELLWASVPSFQIFLHFFICGNFLCIQFSSLKAHWFHNIFWWLWGQVYCVCFCRMWGAPRQDGMLTWFSSVAFKRGSLGLFYSVLWPDSWSIENSALSTYIGLIISMKMIALSYLYCFLMMNSKGGGWWYRESELQDSSIACRSLIMIDFSFLCTFLARF